MNYQKVHKILQVHKLLQEIAQDQRKDFQVQNCLQEVRKNQKEKLVKECLL